MTASDVNLRFGVGRFEAIANQTVALVPPPSIAIGEFFPWQGTRNRREMVITSDLP